MRTRKILTIVLILILACNLSASASSSIVKFSNYLPAMISWGYPTGSASTVNSKWNQPRESGTNPHAGVDVNCSMDGDCYAVWAGWADGFTGTYGKYVKFKIDINNNGVQDDADLYCYYMHLNSVRSDGYYNKGDIIGTTGDGNGTTSQHLHFGAFKEFNDTWYKNEMLFYYSSAWNYGRDLDIFSRTYGNGYYYYITAYIMNDGSVEPLDELVYYYRFSSQNNWTYGGSLISLGNNQYACDVGSKVPSGITVEILFRFKRDLSSGYYEHCFAPAKYYRPDVDPTTSTDNYLYYSMYVY